MLCKWNTGVNDPCAKYKTLHPPPSGRAYNLYERVNEQELGHNYCELITIILSSCSQYTTPITTLFTSGGSTFREESFPPCAVLLFIGALPSVALRFLRGIPFLLSVGIRVALVDQLLVVLKMTAPFIPPILQVQ